MIFWRNCGLLLTLGVLTLGMLGCGGSSKQPSGDPEVLARESEMADIYDMYASYVKVNEHAPQKLADVVPAEGEQAHPRAAQALKSEEYIVVWGVDVNKQPDAILAYQKNAATAGGWVLLANGTTKQMTADEFKAAKK